MDISRAPPREVVDGGLGIRQQEVRISSLTYTTKIV
jgi:hypothetical protein